MALTDNTLQDFSLINEKGHVVLKKCMTNDFENFLLLLQPYADALSGLVVESTYHWHWLLDDLMAANFKAYLANTAAIKVVIFIVEGFTIPANQSKAQYFRITDLLCFPIS
jgi:hypothetical protein